ACCLFAQNSAVVHVGRREHHHRAFRLLDHGQWEEVAPCDFDGEQVALLDRSNAIQQGGNSTVRIRVMHLETNQLTEVDKLHGASQMSILKLWNSNCIAYAVESIASQRFDCAASSNWLMRGCRQQGIIMIAC
ncbi:unnamed protein product, partial [Prorocentrum cordatum]